MKYALITDMHEDVVSLKQALLKIEKLKCDEIICLGDISGFSAPHYNYYDTRNASECLRLIRNNCKIIIAGNHDLHSARITPKINPEFEYPHNWYAMDYKERQNAGAGLVWLYENDELNALYTHVDVAFIKTLPELKVLETQTGNIFLSHFIYPNLTGSAREFCNFIDDFELHKAYISKANCKASFAGHRHYAGMFVASENKIIEKGFNSKYQIIPNDCILVPPITGSRISNGFCIFDSDNFVVEAKRI